MKQILRLALLLLLCCMAVSALQAQWIEQYATYDTDVNGIGTNVSSVGVISENFFIALAADYSNSDNFFVPYMNADSATGRIYWHGYSGSTPGPEGVYDVWTDGGFDQVTMNRAFHMKVTPDSFIYVANNDDNHNVLVFKFENDTINVVPVNGVYPRQETGANGIYAIDVDNNGYVYVCADTSTGLTTDVKIYAPMAQWTSAHTDAPASTIDLPDGIYKGIAASPDGHQVFISDFTNRKILKYKGSPTTGYTLDAGFNFALAADDTTVIPAQPPTPQGLQFMTPNNILLAAVDSWPMVSAGRTYGYGRILLLNPNTGEPVSTDTLVSRIDQAYWNFVITGSYTNRGNGDLFGNAACYASTMDVKFDEKGNIYSQSYNGWAIEKWSFTGQLPTFTGVEKINGSVPTDYRLSQNYPNPFNPTTQIEFAVAKAGFVTLKVFNLLGQEVATLVQDEMGAGSYKVSFDARSLPSGTYFYALRAGSHSEVRKMLFMK